MNTQVKKALVKSLLRAETHYQHIASNAVRLASELNRVIRVLELDIKSDKKPKIISGDKI
jgi:hypothetical protein